MGIFNEIADIEKLKKERDVQGLLKVCSDKGEPSEVRSAAASALFEIGVTLEPEILKKIEDIDRLKKERDVEGLIRILSDKRELTDVRSAVASALAEVGDKRAAKPLRKSLAATATRGDFQHDAGEAWRFTSDLRLNVALALAKIDKRACVDSLIAETIRKKPGFEDYGTMMLRVDAIRALGELEDERAIQPLMRCLKDKDELICEVAKEALEKIQKKQS